MLLQYKDNNVEFFGLIGSFQATTRCNIAVAWKNIGFVLLNS
jgi:hypothetical protein